MQRIDFLWMVIASILTTRIALSAFVHCINIYFAMHTSLCLCLCFFLLLLFFRWKWIKCREKWGKSLFTSLLFSPTVCVCVKTMIVSIRWKVEHSVSLVCNTQLNENWTWLNLLRFSSTIFSSSLDRTTDCSIFERTEMEKTEKKRNALHI